MEQVSIARFVFSLALLAMILAQSVSPVLLLVVEAASAQPTPPVKTNKTEPGLPWNVHVPGRNSSLPILEKPSSSKPQPLNKVFNYHSYHSKAKGGSNTVPADTRVVELSLPNINPKNPIIPDEGDSYTVNLITGDKVTVVARDDGKLAILIKASKPGRSFRIIKANDDLYVIPTDVDLRKFSLDLFSIKLLRQYTNLGIKALPLIVKLRSNVPVMKYSKVASAVPAIASMHYVPLSIINAIAVRVPIKELSKVYDELSSAKSVVAVAPDRIVKAQAIDEPSLVVPSLYESVPMIGAPSLWTLGINGSGVKIAILDTGIDFYHPDFYLGNKSKIIRAASFVDYDLDGTPDESPMDGNGHGTHCAGIAAGTGGYLSFIKGVAPGAEILVGKVLSNNGYGFDSWIISGIEWAINNGANIISMSLGGSSTYGYDPLADAVNKAFEQGVLVVVAAGNSGPGYFTVATPGVAAGALTVGAVSKTGELALFSSWGPTPNGTLKPDVVAPGVSIAAARANNTYMGLPASMYHIYASGTSMATPHVSGFAALVLQLLNSSSVLGFAETKGLKPSALLKDIIVSTATGYEDSDPYLFGAGIVNATNVARLIENNSLIIVDPARVDVVITQNAEKTLEIKLLNPWNKTMKLKVKASIYKYPYTTTDISGSIVVTNSTVNIDPLGESSVHVIINASKLPIGFHAVRIQFIDTSDNTTVGQALVGVTKLAYATLNVTFNGQPIEACAIASGIHVSGEPVSHGFIYSDKAMAYGDTILACGNGTIILSPLYPDTAYIVDIWTYVDGFADYFAPIVIQSSGPNSIKLSIDMASLNYTAISVPSSLYAEIMLEYEARLVLYDVNGTSIASTSMPAMWSISGKGVALNYYGSIDTAARHLGDYTVKLEPVFYAVEAYTQPADNDINILNATIPVDVFYRVYEDMPSGEVLSVNPSNPSIKMLHVHSAISTDPLPDMSGLGLWCGPVDLTVIPSVAGMTGSQTEYRIDTNTGPDCMGVALDSVDTDYVSINAMDFSGYNINNMTVYVPLRMPRGATIWMQFFAYQGLDDYNFTGAYAMGHMFRTVPFGVYDMYSSYYDEPLTRMTIMPNCDANHSRIIYSYDTEIPGDLYWYGHGAIVHPSLCVNMTLNTSLLSGLSFFSNEAKMITYTVSNATYSKGLNLIQFYYGIGVRDIIPLTGYDPLRNMLEPNSTAIIAVVFNKPNMGILNTSSITIELWNNGTLVPLNVIAWSSYGPLPVAYVAVNTSILKPGAYALEISGRYFDNTTDSSTFFIIAIDPAFYVAKPAGKIVGPVTIRVGPPGSGADYTSIAEAVAAATPGSTIEILPGVYNEELIVIDKPLTIVGLRGNSTIPEVRPPDGYPAFIVVSPVEISGIKVGLDAGKVATVPKGIVMVPSEALLPPAAIIAYNTSITIHNVTVERYPRGIAVYGGAVAAYNVSVLLEQVYMVNKRYVYAKEPTPIYVEAASSVEIKGVLSQHVPIIRKTSWRDVNLSEIYVNTENPVLVDVIKNETIIITNASMDIHSAIVLGANVLLRNFNVINTLEVIADNAVITESSAGALLASSAVFRLEGNTIGRLRIDATSATIENTNISEGMAAFQVLNLSIRNSEIQGTALISARPLATITITGSRLRYGTPASLYAILADAAVLNFTGNSVCCSSYGVYIIPLYMEVAPEIVIEGNNFTDVSTAVYIAASPESLMYDYPYMPGTSKPVIKPSFYRTETIFNIGDLTKTYIGYNIIHNAADGIKIATSTAASLVENIINANTTGITIEGFSPAGIFFNNITAPTAIKISSTMYSDIVISYNNIVGDVVVVNDSRVDIKFNYMAGKIRSDESSEICGADYNYTRPVAIPRTRELVVPILFLDEPLLVGQSTDVDLAFFNPRPVSIEFYYTLTTLGGINVHGDIYSTAAVKLDPLGAGLDEAVAEVTLYPEAPGTAALNVHISTDVAYTVRLPLIIKGFKANISINAPPSVQRGEVFNITILINSSIGGNYLLSLSQEGRGMIRICTADCNTTLSTYYDAVNIAPGTNTITLRAIAVNSGPLTLKAVIYAGTTSVRDSAVINVEPNPALAPDAKIDSYPAFIEQSSYDSIVVFIDNVTLPTRLNVEAYVVGGTGRISILSNNYTLIAYEPTYTSITFYASSPGSVAVKIIIHDIDDNVTMLNKTITITVTPGYVYGYKAVYGYVSNDYMQSRANLSFPNTTAWADLWTYVSLSQAATSLQALENILEVPWGCVEQTTSPLLAGIQVYRYLDKHNLWDDASAAMGYDSPEELRNHIVNDIISEGVKRLLLYHAEHCMNPGIDACGLGWYPGLHVDLFFTPYGLLGLIRAYEFQKDYGLTLYSNETLWNNIIEKLVHGLINVQNSDGSWGSYDQLYYTSFALYSLAEAYRLGFKPYNATKDLLESSIANATRYLETVIEAAMAHRSAGVNDVVAVLYALAAVGKAGLSVNTTVVADAVEYLYNNAKGSVDGMVWWSGDWPLLPGWVNYHYTYLTTAKAAIALYEVSGLQTLSSSIRELSNSLAVNATRFLAVNLDWLKGYNTFEAAAVLEAINTVGAEIQFFYGNSGNIVYTIRAGGPNGKILFKATIPVSDDWWSCYISDITNVDVNNTVLWCYSYDYIESGNWLNYANTLYIEVTLNGSASASWYADTIYKYAPISGGESSYAKKEVYIASSKGMIAIEKQEADAAVSASSLIDITKSVAPSVALPGGTVTVKLEVRSKNGTINYVIVSDPIPKGFELVNYTVYPEHAATLDEEYYKSHNGTAVGFAIASLDENGVVIEYTLRVPENATIGELVTMKPANATLFYVPSGYELEPAKSEKTTISIGLPIATAIHTAFYGRSVVTNATSIKLGEILNISVKLLAPIKDVQVNVRILDNNMTVIDTKTLNLTRGWILLVTSAIGDLATIRGLLNKTIYLEVAAVQPNGTILAKQIYKLKLEPVTKAERIDVYKVLVRFWDRYMKEPWFDKVKLDLVRGIVRIWDLTR